MRVCVWGGLMSFVCVRGALVSEGPSCSKPLIRALVFYPAFGPLCAPPAAYACRQRLPPTHCVLLFLGLLCASARTTPFVCYRSCSRGLPCLTPEA